MKPAIAYQLIIHMVSRVIVRGGAVVVSCESVLGSWKLLKLSGRKVTPRLHIR